jgi:mono/diheme cytochrome c family protein
MKKIKFAGPITTLSVLAFVSVFSFAFKPQDEPEGPWVAPASADKMINPLKADNTNLADAKILYKNNCEQCHGVKGDGYGWQSQNIAKKIAPIASAEIQKQSDGALYWKITQGNKPMPGMKKALNDTQRWKLVLFVRELAKPAMK